MTDSYRDNFRSFKATTVSNILTLFVVVCFENNLSFCHCRFAVHSHAFRDFQLAFPFHHHQHIIVGVWCCFGCFKSLLLCFSLCSLLVFFHANDDDDESEPAVQGSISARSLARSLSSLSRRAFCSSVVQTICSPS